MNDKVCLPTFHFTFLMFSFVVLAVWACNNYYKFTHCQSSSKNGIDDSILAPLLTMFGLTRGPTSGLTSGLNQPIGPDQDTMDDLAISGTLPPARRDYRVMADPLKQPSRRWTTTTGGPTNGMFNVQTQGYYPSYQMMGYLNNPEDPDRMLKLFGQRRDGHRYEYYTIHHDDPEIKIPIKVRGDQELMQGDDVVVPGFGNDYKVNLYDYESPRYLPNVL